MRNKAPLIIGVIALLVLILLGLMFALPRVSLPTGQNSEEQSEQISELDNRPAPVENEITLTKDGFVPDSITIKVGEVVTFVNDSDTTAAVHSNPHPVHNLYRELNLGEFEPGKTLGVILEVPGTYSYHNHLDPDQQGSILVEQ